jgi:hypothetical protein
MAKNVDGVHNFEHKQIIQDAALFYVSMCEFADIDTEYLLMRLFGAFYVSSTEEKIAVINPNRLKKVDKKIYPDEIHLYNLFLYYCVLDICENNPISNSQQVADFCQNFINKNHAKTLPAVAHVANFNSFIKEAFFQPYDSLRHNEQHYHVFSNDLGKKYVRKRLTTQKQLPKLIINLPPFSR